MGKFEVKLNKLRAMLTSDVGLEIEVAARLFSKAFALGCRSEAEIAEYRTATKFKVFRDEVSPTLFLLDRMKIGSGKLKFAFDSSVPDAFLNRKGRNLGIEVTQALGTEEAAILRTLNTEGSSPGFVGKSDSSFKDHFPMKKRDMYSTAEAFCAVKQSISVRIDAKMSEKFRGMLLIVSAPLNAIPSQEWEPLKSDLLCVSKKSPFGWIVVVDRAKNGKPIFLKGEHATI